MSLKSILVQILNTKLLASLDFLFVCLLICENMVNLNKFLFNFTQRFEFSKYRVQKPRKLWNVCIFCKKKKKLSKLFFSYYVSFILKKNIQALFAICSRYQCNSIYWLNAFEHFLSPLWGHIFLFYKFAGFACKITRHWARFHK